MKKLVFALAASSLFVLGMAHAAEPSMTRSEIGTFSPIILQTLQSIEKAQGVVIADKDLRTALQSQEFARQYEIELRKWCDIASNARTMACTDSSPTLSVSAQGSSAN